ncbi:MAG: hypothetical protein WBD58_11980 [Geitlerinemataceae cyanobacterium]
MSNKILICQRLAQKCSIPSRAIWGSPRSTRYVQSTGYANGLASGGCHDRVVPVALKGKG